MVEVAGVAESPSNMPRAAAFQQRFDVRQRMRKPTFCLLLLTFN
jgi:hypothetical protein